MRKCIQLRSGAGVVQALERMHEFQLTPNEDVMRELAYVPVVSLVSVLILGVRIGVISVLSYCGCQCSVVWVIGLSCLRQSGNF